MQTSERDKMLAGELYDPLDPALVAARTRTRRLLQAFNVTGEDDAGERRRLLRELLPHAAADLWLQPPFYCDYGENIEIGERVFLNFNCVLLDVARLRIGARTLLGPAVQVYTATHPLDAVTRAHGLELGAPIDIGEDCWIGGGAIVCPGVRIGRATVVGAGSVVTRDLPEGVLAAGNPCRVLRPLAPSESQASTTE